MLRWFRNQWDRTAAVVAFAAGAVALLVGWLGTSGTVYPAQQIPFVISGGLMGVVLIGLGATMWVSADLRDEWRKLDEIHEILVGTERAPTRSGRSHPLPDGDGTAPEVADLTTTTPRSGTAVR